MGSVCYNFALRLDPCKHYAYTFADDVSASPNKIELNSFSEVVARTVNEALEFAAGIMDSKISENGIPENDCFYHTARLDAISEKNRGALIELIFRHIDWDQKRLER